MMYFNLFTAGYIAGVFMAMYVLGRKSEEE